MYTAQIKGIPVILHVKALAGYDDFGAPIIDESQTVTVENVLVTPVSTEDVNEVLNLTGKHAIYTLCIPKGDTNEWESATVEFFGRSWRTIGEPKVFIEDMIPLKWNAQIQVERYG